MTLGVYETDHNKIKISEQGHGTEWAIEIDDTQIDYVIQQLQDIRQEQLSRA